MALCSVVVTSEKCRTRFLSVNYKRIALFWQRKKLTFTCRVIHWGFHFLTCLTKSVVENRKYTITIGEFWGKIILSRWIHKQSMFVSAVRYLRNLVNAPIVMAGGPTVIMVASRQVN